MKRRLNGGWSMRLRFLIGAWVSGLLALGSLASAEVSDLSISNTAAAPNSNVTASGADIRVTKSGPVFADFGGPPFDYVITLSNAGPDAGTNVSFHDQLPAGLKFPPSLVQNTGPIANCVTSPAPPGSGGTVDCSIALLANGESAQFTITTEMLPSFTPPLFNNVQAISNTVTASASTADPDQNNSSTVITPIGMADLSITKARLPAPSPART